MRRICRFCGSRTTNKINIGSTVDDYSFICGRCKKILRAIIIEDVSVGDFKDIRWLCNEIDKIKLRLSKFENQINYNFKEYVKIYTEGYEAGKKNATPT